LMAAGSPVKYIPDILITPFLTTVKKNVIGAE